MEALTTQAEAIILKGIAQQILQMNVPSVHELDKMLLTFGITCIHVANIADDFSKDQDEINIAEVADNKIAKELMKRLNYSEEDTSLNRAIIRIVDALTI